MKKFYTMLLLAFVAMTAFAEEAKDTTYVMFDFNQNPWNYPLTTTMKGWGPDYSDKTGATNPEKDFTWPVPGHPDKLITITVYSEDDADASIKPAVYACVDNDAFGQSMGYITETKINVLFTNIGTTMRFKSPEGYQFGKMVFYTFHSDNFLVGDVYDEEHTYYNVIKDAEDKHDLKFWTPDSPKKNPYGLDTWEGDAKNIHFIYQYFSSHFMKIDIRLVPDGSSGISNLQTTKKESNTMTTLDGRTVNKSESLRKGVYIVDGKKVVVK